LKKEEAPDLSTKSTGDLVKDMFNIINDHIGERGSISIKEVDETLYQKLKPYLAEIVKRAKAKMMDARAYLFGAVDAMPDGKAKDIYETAARRYADEQDNEHYERLAAKKSHTQKTAYDYGKEAFAKGLKSAPAHDSAFMDFYKSIENQDEKIKSMKDWMKGWHDANLKAPIQGEKSQEASPYGAVADKVAAKLATREKFTRNELFFMCKDAFGGTLAEGKFSAKDAYDAMEMGINKYLLTLNEVIDPIMLSSKYAESAISILKNSLTLSLRKRHAPRKWTSFNSSALRRHWLMLLIGWRTCRKKMFILSPQPVRAIWQSSVK